MCRDGQGVHSRECHEMHCGYQRWHVQTITTGKVECESHICIGGDKPQGRIDVSGVSVSTYFSFNSRSGDDAARRVQRYLSAFRR